MVGQVPDKSISYWGERYNSDFEKIGRTVVKPKERKNTKKEDLATTLNKITNQENQGDPANMMIMSVLQKTYDFSISDIEDSCEVWVAKVINEKKLSSFVKNGSNHGAGSMDKEDKYFQLSSLDLSPLWKSMEVHSKHLLYDETGDTRRFDMVLEYAKFKDFDTVNEALAPFGLRLFKEKRLEKLKLIEFHE